MRVANPRQGDFAEPDQRFKGEGPVPAHDVALLRHGS